MTPYQYERLSWLLGAKSLDQSELKMIDDMLSSNWVDHDDAVVAWLMEWLRRKPYRLELDL